MDFSSHLFCWEKARHNLLNNCSIREYFYREGGKSDCIRDPGAAGSLHNKWWAVRPDPQTHSASKHLLRACCQQGSALRTRVSARSSLMSFMALDRSEPRRNVGKHLGYFERLEKLYRGHDFDQDVVWKTCGCTQIFTSLSLILIGIISCRHMVWSGPFKKI